MSIKGRPLSPHLSIYRWPISMTLSILHRMTGVGLSVGLIAFVFWLQSIAFGEASFQLFHGLLASFSGKILLFGWCFSFFFHLCNGIRHLFWDAGLGFEKNQANTTAWLAVFASAALTGAYWLILQGGVS